MSADPAPLVPAKTCVADARTDLALVSDALGRLLAIYEDEIDLGDPPVSRPEWLETAVQIIRREASRA